MNAPADRILELALEEVVGGHRPPDLEASILARVHGRRVTVRRFAWAAAALLLAALGLRVVLSLSTPVIPPTPTPVALDFDDAEREAASQWIALQLESTMGIRVSTPEGRARLKAMWQSQRDLLDLLDAKPEGWPWVRSKLLPLPEGMKARDVRSRVLEVLGRDPDPETEALVMGHLGAEAYSVNEGTLLMLAERGSTPAHEALARAVASEPPFAPLALPGVYFALREDDRGAAAMRQFAASPRLREAQPAAALACALGLRRLGDDLLWPVVTDALDERFEDRLEAGDLEEARRMVAAWTLVGPAVGGRETIRVGDLGRRAARLGRELASTLDTAEAIRGAYAEIQSESEKD